MPAKTNITKPPKANNMGVVRRILPPQIVATQANTLIPVGIDTNMVVTMKNNRSQPGVPLTYIWCTQTMPLTTAINMEEIATTL